MYPQPVKFSSVRLKLKGKTLGAAADSLLESKNSNSFEVLLRFYYDYISSFITSELALGSPSSRHYQTSNKCRGHSNLRPEHLKVGPKHFRLIIFFSLAHRGDRNSAQSDIVRNEAFGTKAFAINQTWSWSKREEQRGF